MSVSHVDWDLLAEHLGGALAGTPEGERVARLVATDPTWAGAAAHLTEALDAVAADLRTVPPAPAMPDDVAARLEAALHSAAAPADSGAAPADSGAASRDSDAAGRTAVAAVPTTRPPVPPPHPERPPGHPGDSGGHAATGPGRRDRRRRRRAAWGAALAVTAGVAAFAAIGLGPLGLVQGLDSEDSGAGDAAGAPEVAVEDVPPLSAQGDGGGPVMIASGTDYGPELSPFLTNVAPAAPRVEGEADDESFGNDLDGRDRIGSAPEPPLDRVWNDPQPCLAAVEAAQPEPAYAHQMDFATFQGDPAVVIWLIAEDGSEWVWVAGPNCGTAAAGPDERYQTRLR